MTEQEEFEFRRRFEAERGAKPKEDLASKAAAAGMSMRDGKVNWGVELQKQIDALALANQWQMPSTNIENGYASYTPACDDTHIYAAFGNGIVAGYDLVVGALPSVIGLAARLEGWLMRAASGLSRSATVVSAVGSARR